MNNKNRLWIISISSLNIGLKTGVIGAILTVLLSLIGMVEAFSQREIIHEIISMGHTLLLLAGCFIAYLSTKKTLIDKKVLILANGLIAGVLSSGSLILLVLLGNLVNLRSVFINASPVLFNLLLLGQGIEKGSLLLILIGTLIGLFSGTLYLLPQRVRKTIILPLSSVLLVGVLQDLLRPTLAAWGPLSILSDWLFTANGLSLSGAIALAIVIGVGSHFWSSKGKSFQKGVKNLSLRKRRIITYSGFFILIFLLLILPHLLGLFLSEVLTIVGLYILLGLGLNIVVGYAGLLDLGYVAFFAIGAYTTAILTSPELGFFQLSFWTALPIAILMGIFSGVLLGIPVLKMRGDYLAIATLGFGEIIRILVLSDFLRPWLGGAQGIGKIPKATIGSFEFARPQDIYYLILAGCLLVIFISLRLKNSRIGRAWMAMREDEDVAQAMGINLVATKLLAFATGAGFSALSGAIFASKIGSVYPHSFNVMISINVVCLIIVGGMGSIPGVMVGSFALVGLPELLREFAEYRLLVYGTALVTMMLIKPEGLWPETIRRGELHEEK
ncbi:MAG: branched-chain amino acid ABC transporter permease [Thermodesulfobacteriota bacterium]